MIKEKIYYHHTDSEGPVYYANYLKFMEEARTEFMAERGVFLKEQMARSEFFVVSRQVVDYKAPAFYGDVLEVESEISEISAVRIKFEHIIKNQKGEICVSAATTLVYIGSNFKPKVMPDEIRIRLKGKDA
ncbi:MAG: thioesterase family protein [Candidatus Omnitrophota bacterium]|nr:acyl-CoA thioesterase [Candidatus Omnitrophota bacterium]MBU1929333.1 acyl-CoA thioesterase [Candidatus Omnitrophota bacterium]MBU2035625.1 acyl-CoA thioesterase [Candidatus Omnitrophota bacterium]MBU2221126.1 acyl-CoA thioesterase [Candidatus Omnitrophota bacterium]MBU2258704.1 acyl-CoA thioesterase [Candidatus Omnitrophota bacterium]